MKKYSFIILCLALVAAACNKEQKAVDYGPEMQGVPEKEIILYCEGDLETSVETKTTAVASLPSTLYWGGTTGTSTEAQKWASTSETVSSSKISTGKYQTATATAYNYYASNVAMTVGNGATVSAANTTDVICGRAASTTSTTPSITLNHIFARTGTVALSLPSGYSQSSVSFMINGSGAANTGTAGTYNIKAGTWSSCTALSSATSLTNSTDLYLIPGTYTLSCTFTMSKGEDFTATYTKTGSVTLTGGKINNITASYSGDPAQPIVISVSLTAWSSQAVSCTLS